MGSLEERVLASDGAYSYQAPDGRANGLPSSTNARPPASDTVGAPSEIGGFADDEVVGARGTQASYRAKGIIEPVGDRIADVVGKQFENFLDTYREDPASGGAPLSSAQDGDRYYIAQIHGLRLYNLSTLYVDYRHVMHHGNGVLAEAVAEDYYRYLPYLTQALHNLIARYERQYFQEHRQSSAAGAAPDEAVSGKTANQQTDKVFALAFYNLPVVARVRQLRTASIGKLLSISGTVTRTSEVRPELAMATFVCDNCSTVVPNVEQAFRYTEPAQCPNLTCANRHGWRLDIRQSTFVDWQKNRIQENSAEIPTGSMPRTIDVIFRGEMVDRAKAGEKCLFTGTLIVVPDVSQFRMPGVRAQASREGKNAPRGTGDVGSGAAGVGGMRELGVRDLTYRLAFLACMVTPDTTTAGQSSRQQLQGQADNILSSLNQVTAAEAEGNSEELQAEYLATLSAAEIEDLRSMVQKPDIFMRLVDSVAPMVYGHQVIKKGLLLQLMGGVSKVTPEGMSLRGDINICIVGDPSTSKSQFLKYICSFLPRSVYTSGKASSAAGLTAAVVKDEETGEFTIEAGALMLADNGICAIDEFDKMDIGDQVAIHEAMEQQTISIAKAGIQATLNARTSILAAANPVGGRYNRRTTLRANINMSAPIMSRFDLFFVVLDECDEGVDRHLAEHIVAIHRLRDAAVQAEYSTEQLQRYIRFARTFKPEFTAEARVLLVQKYRELRADDAQGGIGRNSYRITVRQLESMIRLSEAIAKACCVTDVTPEFVREAFHLLRQSIISVEKDDVDVDVDDDGGQPTSPRENAHVPAHPDVDAPMHDPGDDDDDEGDHPRPSTTTASQQQRTKITYDKYMAILNLLVRRITSDQERAEDGVPEDELLLWYLEQMEEELDTQEDLDKERALARKVLKRMVKDNVLMQIRGDGLAADDGGMQQPERIVYVIHPNCAVEDLG